MEQEIVAENLALMTSKLQFYPDLLASALDLPQQAPPFFDHIVFCWLGLAMGNAPIDIKSYANAGTDSNEGNGVSQAIKLHVLAESSQLKI